MLIISLQMLTAFAVCYSAMLFSSKFLRMSLKIDKTSLICIFLYAFLSTLIHGIREKTITVIVYFIILTLILKIVFRISISKSVMSALMCNLVLMISDASSLLVFFIININPLELNLYETTTIGNIVVSVVMILLSKISFIQNVLFNVVSKSEKKSVSNIVTALLIISLLYTFIYYNIAQKSIEIIILNILTLTLFSITLIRLYVEKSSKNHLVEEYEKMNEYVKVYEEIIEKDRIQRHENKNQLITIKGMISKKDKKTHEYIDSLVQDNNDMSNKWVSELKNIPIGGLKGLLFYKVNKMRSIGIEANITISRSLENSKLQDIDTKTYKQLCQIIGVYIDNAIEACQEAEVKSIGIEIYKDKDIFEFIISNTYSGNLDIENMDASGYTTKGNGHGYGLSLVKDIINSNAQFFQNREIINDYYIQHLYLDLTD